MKTIKDKVVKSTLLGLLMALATTMFYTPTASAHGEKSQAAFMRMRTIMWYDLNWSADQVAVNESVEISGKFHVFGKWPDSVAPPSTSFLNIGIPGPVFIRTASYIGDQITPRSVELELNQDYTFKVVLKARRPGEWHVHTMLNVSGGGPVIGPGKWVAITGSMADFKNEYTTLTGKTVDLETFNIGTIYGWSFLWYIIGICWMVYWCKGPVFLPRFIMVSEGRAKELISPTDKKVGLAFMIGTLVLVGFGYSSANSNYPITIPLQAGTMRGMVPLPPQHATVVHANVDDATYRVPGRSLSMTVTIHNASDSAVQVAEFQAGSVRFLDPDVFVDETLYPENLLAPEGLTVSDNSPIAPDETRTVTITATDAAWEIERMSDIIYDPDSQFAGMLFFVNDAGDRHSVIVDGPLIPAFM